MCQQAALGYAKDLISKGMAPLDANVEVVRMMGVRIVEGKIPRDLRAAMNAAVKAGRLGRLPKDGLRPEAYHHPNARAKAIDMRNEAARQAIEAIRMVLG